MGQPHIIHIVLDAFRHDHLHRQAKDGPLCPFLEDLCGTATEFRQAISPAPHTCPMHASLFTGRLPNEHGVYLVDDVIGKHLPLPELTAELRDAGYLTIGLSDNAFFDPGSAFGRGFDLFTHTPNLSAGAAVSRLAYYRQRLLSRLPRRLRPGRDTSGTPAGSFRYQERLARHRRLLAGFETSLAMARNLEPDRPIYLYVNLMPTHGAYLFEPEDAAAARPEGLGGPLLAPRRYLTRMMLDFLGTRPMDELTLAELHWAYAAAARYVSRIAAGLVEVLDRHLDPANTDLAVLSDHGELLGEYGAWEHGLLLHGELVRVPLIVRSPALPSGTQSDSLVQTHWLWRMARERAGLPEPEEWPAGQGSLLDAARGAGADVAWSFSDATADLSLMRRAMESVMQLGSRSARVSPRPLDPHLQAVRTKAATVILTKSGRRLACSRDPDGTEHEAAGAAAESISRELLQHLLPMDEPATTRSPGSSDGGPPDPQLLGRLRDLGYAD
jgi:hypothetical protein